MHIEELEDGEMEARSREEGAKEVGERKKRALVGVGARFLFYPTLLYNLVRNRLETTFHWWDEVDQYLLLGAVPFPADIPRLKQVGVRGVVTLNEPYETLVPTSFYHAHGIENLVIPTRDYLYAPSFDDICQAVDFIHKNASCGKTTYVHCKAGRGRSTTIVLCYLVQHKGMTPTVAYEHVRSRRPRVLLAASQRQAVQEYYHLRVEKTVRCSCLGNPITRMATPVSTTRNFVTFDDSSFIIISETDLDGYVGELNHSSGNAILAEFYKVQLAGHTAMARLSRIWVRYRAGAGAGAGAMVPESRIRRETCSSEADPVCCGHNPFLLTGMAVNL